MNPVFLVGAERSGTTLLRLMLDAHPQISWLKEFEYSVDRISAPGCWPDIGDYIEYLSTNRIFQSTGFVVNEKLDYPEIIKSFLVQKQQRDNKPIIGATCHRHYDILFHIFPKARFIYLLRDPRDVARSNIGMGWAGNVWYGVDQWIEAEKLWKEIKKRIPAQDYIEVKSEELITKPKEVLSDICHFLQVKYDPVMLRYPEYTTYLPPDPTLTEQWRRKLSPSEIELVEYKVGSLMSDRGYDFFSTVRRRPSKTTILLLNIQNKLYKILFRIKRYGVILFLSDFLSRRLRLKGWSNNLKKKMNNIDREYLK